MYRVLAATVLVLVPTVAFANCPTSLDPTSRFNCFNRAINAAATTIASLQAENTALEARLSDLEAHVDLQDGDIADLFTASASTDASVAGLQGDVDDLTTTLDTLGVIDVGDLFTYLTVDTATDSVVFSGANVYVQSGSGATDGAVNGVGNLIVGYDEDAAGWGDPASDRTGSHNLVVGMGHSYSSYAGLVAGFENFVTGAAASVTGGFANHATGKWSAVLGGTINEASGNGAAISGGTSNIASGSSSSVSGGYDNTASGVYASILAGLSNTAVGTGSAISGGGYNDAEGGYSSILGGDTQVTTTTEETIPTSAAADVGDLFAYLTIDTATDSVIFSGANVYVQSGSGATDGAVNGLGNLIVGYNETADELGYGTSARGGSHNLVVGMGHSYPSSGGFVDGMLNRVEGLGASVCGGAFNVASGGFSGVSGGFSNQASGDFSSVSGGSFNLANGQTSSVLGGYSNSAEVLTSTVSGGVYNSAGGNYSAILGGYSETTSDDYETYPE